jgi:hypothetical protein
VASLTPPKTVHADRQIWRPARVGGQGAGSGTPTAHHQSVKPPTMKSARPDTSLSLPSIRAIAALYVALRGRRLREFTGPA